MPTKTKSLWGIILPMARPRKLPRATSSAHRDAAFALGRRVLERQGFQHLGQIALDAARSDADIARVLLTYVHNWTALNAVKNANAKAALEPLTEALEEAAEIKPPGEDGPDVERLFRALSTAAHHMGLDQAAALARIPNRSGERVLELARTYTELFVVNERDKKVAARNRFRLFGTPGRS